VAGQGRKDLIAAIIPAVRNPSNGAVHSWNPGSRCARPGMTIRFGEGLRVRTPVLADPSVFETDCRPLQRSPP